LTIPFAAHVNIPYVEWLYTGIGLNINIPLFGMLDSTINDSGGPKISTKGKTFVGLPIDLGFDFVKPGRGGARFFFRVTPEFHKVDGVDKTFVTVPIGFAWQIWNWKVLVKNKMPVSKTRING